MRSTLRHDCVWYNFQRKAPSASKKDAETAKKQTSAETAKKQTSADSEDKLNPE